MKKFTIGLAVALSLLVMAVLVLPGLIDWNGYRAQIAQQVSALAGRPVTIDGAVDFTMLPTPMLAARSVRIAGSDAAAEPMATIGALEARLGFLPLLSGRVEVERVVLVDPVILVEPSPAGGTNWRAFGERAPRGLRLDRMSIENGTVIWRDGAGRTEQAERIFAQLSAESLAGPFQIIGSLVLRGRALTVDLTGGRLSAGGALPVNATIGLDGAPAEFRFAGLLTPRAGRIQGDLRAEGSDLGAVIERLAPATGPAVATAVAGTAFAVRGAVVATGDSVELNGATIELGETRATGAVSVGFGDTPRLDLALAANQLDLDPWLAGTDRTALGLLNATTFAPPPGWAATLDIDIDALTWRDQLLHDVGLEAALEAGSVSVRHLGAQVPGGAVSLTGTVGSAAGAPRLDISGTIAASDARRTLAWLGYPLEAVPEERLRRLSGVARFTGTADQFQLSGVELAFDGSKLEGALSYDGQGRPGIGLRLAVDSFDLDAYYPAGSDRLATDGVTRLRDLIGTVDANIDATIGALTVGGTTLQAIRLDGTMSGGAVTLRDAKIGDIAGAAIGVTGSLGGIEPLGAADLSVEFSSETVGRLADLVGLALPLPPERLDPVTLTVRLQGGADRLALRVNGQAAGGAAELGGTVMRPFEAPVYDLAARVTHPRFTDAAGLLWPDYRPQAAPGPLDLYGRIGGTPDRLRLSDLQGRLGPVTLAGSVALDRDDAARPRLDADLRSSAVAIADFLPPREGARPARGTGPLRWSSVPLDLAFLNTFDAALNLTSDHLAFGGLALAEPALRASLSDGTLDLEALSGGAFGGRLGLSGRLVARDRPTIALSLDLVGADLAQVLRSSTGDGGGLTGRLDLGADVTAEGATEQDLIGSLAGSGLVAVRDGVLPGTDLAAAARRLAELTEPLAFIDVVREALSAGETPFATLNATYRLDRGVAETDDLRIVTAAGIGEGEGIVDLARWQVDLAADFSLYDLPEAPPFGIEWVGPLDRPQQQLETRALQAYIADRAAEALARRPPALDAPPADTPASLPTTETAPADPLPADPLPADPLPAETPTAAPAEMPAETPSEPPAGG